MKNKVLPVIIACIGIYACNNPGTSKIEREGEPAIYLFEEGDEDMNAAIRKARLTLDTFKTALGSNNESYSFFSLKTRFKTSNGGEHIWLSDITIKDGQLFGVVGNEPESTDEVQLGDTVNISPADISDWMFLDKGVVKGAYTVRLVRDRMSKEEQEQFDAETGLIFE